MILDFNINYKKSQIEKNIINFYDVVAKAQFDINVWFQIPYKFMQLEYIFPWIKSEVLELKHSSQTIKNVKCSIKDIEDENVKYERNT